MNPQGSYEFTYVVQNEDTAVHLKMAEGDEFPGVLATNRMVGLMELAAARLMQPTLPRGWLSVGVSVQVVHKAATLPGEVIQIRAAFTRMSDRLYEFDIVATDRVGIAGRAIHTRAGVQRASFLESVVARFSNGPEME